MSKDLTEALRRLTEEAISGTKSTPLVVRGAAPTVTSGALLAGAANKTGIASPLVETLYADREFHTAIMISSTDGLFTLRIKPVKKIFMKDATASDVVLEFKSP